MRCNGRRATCSITWDFGVSDLRRSRAFYEKALAPLGIAIVREVPEREAMGFGAAGKPFFWIAKAEGLKGHLHVAFVTENRAAVDAFHRAALAAGGADNGRARPSGRIIIRTITAPSSSIRTAITSKRSATGRNDIRPERKAISPVGGRGSQTSVMALSSM